MCTAGQAPSEAAGLHGTRNGAPHSTAGAPALFLRSAMAYAPEWNDAAAIAVVTQHQLALGKGSGSTPAPSSAGNKRKRKPAAPGGGGGRSGGRSGNAGAW